MEIFMVVTEWHWNCFPVNDTSVIYSQRPIGFMTNITLINALNLLWDKE